MISRNAQSTTRLMTIWGAGAKNSVEELKEAVKVLVDEYFVEGDLDEALNCVRELDAPHFGHEVHAPHSCVARLCRLMACAPGDVSAGNRS